MFDEKKMREDEVFSQDLSLDDLDAVAGGFCDMVADAMTPSQETIDEYQKNHPAAENCTRKDRRNIYAGGFPNCAATVEDGSWCGSNDACYNDEVDYYGFTPGSGCEKAWR